MSTQRSNAKKGSARATPERRSARVRRALTAGDRPFVLLFAALAVGIGMTAFGPLQVFTEAAERVDELEEERDQLHDEVDQLDEREQRLEDPEEIELLARRELGLVRPGEDPIVVVPDEEAEAEAQERAEADDADDDEPPWWRRLGRALGDLWADE